MKCFNLIDLNPKEVENMAKKFDWGEEINKRLGVNFNYDLYADVILPITFNDTWVLMSWNF